MAQKISPRSLRTVELLSNNFSLYSDYFYANVWKKSYMLLYNLYSFSLKNIILKKRRKFGRRKGSRKKSVPSFILNRFFLSNQNPVLTISPILIKFANQSFSKKYNPIRISRSRSGFRNNRFRRFYRKNKKY